MKRGRASSPFSVLRVSTLASTIEEAHASISTDDSALTMGGELAKIGYVGDGPNYFDKYPISAHFEINIEQHTDLEKANKPVGWVTGWQGKNIRWK
jgi:N-carbamoyl-L-amino-acid hydrolase